MKWGHARQRRQYEHSTMAPASLQILDLCPNQSTCRNFRYPNRKSKDEHRRNHHVLSEQVWTLLCVAWPVPLTHLSLWCRWCSTLCLVLAMPCPFPGLAACGKILTFISTTGPAASDTRSTSDPYAQVPAFTICPTMPSPHYTHTKCIWTHRPTHWHERHILTSSCSTLDQQKGSHM